MWARRLALEPTFSCDLGWGPGQLLESFWRDVFARAQPGWRVLEIGCGAAHVSLWAAEAGRDLTIIASDRVEHPGGGWSRSDVTLLGGAPAEALPLPAGGIDMLVSNFAIEYAPLGAALREAGRVLRPGGCAILVVHAADSAITATSRLAMEVHAAIAREGIAELVRRAAALASDDPHRRALLDRVLARRAGHVRPPVSYTGVEYFDLAERLRDGAASSTDVSGLDEAVAMRLDLSREQSRVALDAAGAARLEALAREAGLQGYLSEMTSEDDAAGRWKAAWIAVLYKAGRVL